MFLASTLAALALAAGAAEAQAAPAPAADDKPVAEKPMKTKKVCQTIEVTGARLPQKRCVTVKVPADESEDQSAQSGR